MKKLTLFVALVVFIQSAYAGGLLTNSNQSAQYIRMLSRNASLGIDAVYYNPAGLIKLEDGWHFALYNQTIFQEKTVNTSFPLLNNGYYVGDVQVPVFPTAFAVYKMEDWAFSLGFGPNSGGGAADFERGLPSFEIPISKVVPAMAGLAQISPALNVTGYNADLSFSGTSVFWGIQLGASYNINDIFSVYGGVRYLPSKNSYEGSIQNIQLKVGDEYIHAPSWLGGTASLVSDYAGMAQAAADMPETLQPIVAGGGGSFTLTQLEGAGYINAIQKTQIESGLKQIGLSQAQIEQMNLEMIQGAYSQASPQFRQQAQVLSGTAAALNATADQLGDKEVKTTQTGAGFTPMVGLNISPNEYWNIALKYEMKTSLTLENETDVDDLGLFPDGAESNNDIPAIFAAGIGYKKDWLEAQLSYNLYFDKGVEWGYNVRDLAVWENVDATQIRKRKIDNNYYEVGLGLQFNLNDNFALSVGGLRSAAGIADSWQSDFSFSNPSYSAGAGFMYKITDKLTLDAGVSNTFYEERTVTFQDPDIGAYEEIYDKTTLNIAVGLSYSIF